MTEYDDLEASYNGDTEYDMWVDFENSGSPDIFDDANIDKFIDNLKDWD